MPAGGFKLFFSLFFCLEILKMNPSENPKIRILMIYAILLPFFGAVSLWSEKTAELRILDFGVYWQAGHMILSGQNVYNSQEWTTERSLHGTALNSEPTFQYPLPFAVLLTPLGALPVMQAYALWIFLGEVAILTSVFILLAFWDKRSLRFEFLAIISAFLFRPAFYVILSGQLPVMLLLVIALSIKLFGRKMWFLGGLVASLMALKPSIGIPFLLLTSLWLLSKKQWGAMAGMMAGAILLWGIGDIYNPHWAMDYLAIGRYSFGKYYGMQTTLWGLAGLYIKAGKWSVAAGMAGVCSVIAITGYFIINKRMKDDPYLIIAAIVPATLLIAPYSWSYEQILLIVPILYILINLSFRQGELKAVLFSLFIIIFSISLIWIARILGHDVWSLLVSGIIWVWILYLLNDSQ